VGEPAGFAAALLLEGVPAVLGLDVPLGLPRGFAAGRAEAGFVEFCGRARATRASSRWRRRWKGWARTRPSIRGVG
jgi:hypothetical protein